MDRPDGWNLQLGKVKFDPEQPCENMAAFIVAVNAARPSDAKGQFIRSATLTTTMGPGIRLDLAQTLGMRTA